MGWAILALLALALATLLWRFGGFRGPVLQFLCAALLLAGAGYAWQGRPGLSGVPVATAAREKLPETIFAATRGDLLGRFDRAARWLTIADHFHRTGDTMSAVGVIRAGLRASPNQPALWAGLGHALFLHAGSVMTPAAELAFKRGIELSPQAPGPRFYYGLSLAQVGRLAEAEALWTALLADGAPDAAWRPAMERRLEALKALRAATRR